jgi:hypothetical protein
MKNRCVAGGHLLPPSWVEKVMFLVHWKYVRYLLCSLVTAWFGFAFAHAAEVDFTNYNVPLYEQIVNRIKAKIWTQLGDGTNTRDRYFIIPFASQNDGNDPAFSHSFISVIRVFEDGKQPKLIRGLKKEKYKNREFEAFTISWLPSDFPTNPHFFVFEGFCSFLFPRMNTCPLSIGRVYKLEETIKFAVDAKNAVCMWGPYEIAKGGFDLVVKRQRLLNKGNIQYRADDRVYRRKKIAVNCFHAMEDLNDLFPDGGIFDTGFNVWGINGTARALAEYTKKSQFREFFLEPVNERHGRYGFVYVLTRNDHRFYDPFKRSSVYHR